MVQKIIRWWHSLFSDTPSNINNHSNKQGENNITGTDILGKAFVSVKHLYSKYNFSYTDRYKESVWQKVQQKHGALITSGSLGDISIRRVCLKYSENNAVKLFSKTKCSRVSQFFDYIPSDESTKRWYLNFADPSLFVACLGPLFAQDEIQTLEHPLLCAIRNFLTNENIEGLEAYTRTDSLPTPFLFTNVPNFVEVNTMPTIENGSVVSVYGNSFSYYEHNNPDILDKSIRIRNKCTHSNIISISAPCPRYGYYDKETILDMLLNIIAAFDGAKSMLQAEDVEIHTGRWGAGAFGGNEELALVVQIIGAEIAGIDHLVFHAVTDRYFENALRVVENLNCQYNESKIASIDDIVNSLFEKKYQWGMSDGN